MARVLMVSKFRIFRGGVERHLNDLMNGLTSRGHVVKLFSSEDVESAGGLVFSASEAASDRIKSAEVLLWNSGARDLLRNVAKEFQPDLVHYHSISHQLSPSVLNAFDAPSVMTLHDYKLAAPCYTLVRDGDICQACVGKTFAAPAIRYKCVSGSAAGSALCAVEGMVHRHRYRSGVGRFIVPSRFAFDVAVRGGLPADRVAIVPWGVASASGDFPRSSNVAFYAGRFHPTKGIQVLLEAWLSLPADHGCALRIAGEGELEPLVREAASKDATVEFLGMVPREIVMREVSSAAVAVMPSLAPETMGLSALEALVAGTPVISSGRGALADLSGLGVWTLPSTDAPAMRAALNSLLLQGQVEVYRRDLSTRDLSLYSLDRMIEAIEAEYVRVSDVYRTGLLGS
jgi:glycosyltransferase involved in cell wall biosynthesis